MQHTELLLFQFRINFRDIQVSVPSCVLLNKVRALGCDCKSAPPVSHPVFHFSPPHPVTSRATKVVW